MKWISVFALSLSIWGLGCGVAIAAEPSLGSSFKEWCLNGGSLSDETRKTVYILLEQAGTSDCSQADATLLSRTELQLWDNSITDISPLAGLSNLTVLNLGRNSITDVSPLAELSNLTKLSLGSNSITDISPLAGLSNLTKLYLDSNSITDVSPLAGLSNLTELFLSSNSITDASPLAQLTNLRRLFLGDNPIAQPTCPVSPPGVCSFSPRCLLFSVEGSETYCIKFQDF
ncbi:MAG: leucine-rich repeat domain-containing protein [Coleofasciculus sp. B1-GNL1-01]|uniref:leucine-rich repeat domain-containing protein n=1 Tax=Coleofasciculus sp. B1-GNL1-01 TaxID=3068484 RepID=UPI0032FDA0BB